jgi:hypothetical protein
VRINVLDERLTKASLADVESKFQEELAAVRKENAANAQLASEQMVASMRETESVRATLRPQLDRAEAQLVQAQSQLASARAEVEAADRDYSKAHMDGLMHGGSSVRPGDEPAPEQLRLRDEKVELRKVATQRVNELESVCRELRARIAHQPTSPGATPIAEPVLTAERYFEHLPKPIAFAETDAEGRFVLRVRKGGHFVVAARASRELLSGTDHYYWLVKVPENAAKGVPIMLTNSSLSLSGAPESLIHAE